jgi:hypothetical protein
MSFEYTTEEEESAAYVNTYMAERYVSTFRHMERFTNPAPFDAYQAV